jgi:hypothetical protein
LHQRDSSSPRPQQSDDSDADEEQEEDDDEEQVDDEDEEDEEDVADNASWAGILSEIEDNTASAPSVYLLDQDVISVERHVRFAGVPDSDSDSTDSDTTEEIQGFFPDIFVKQSSLDPAFRREIEYDPDESSNSSSFWDFHSSQDKFGADSDNDEVVAADDDTPTVTPTASQPPTEMSTPVPSDDVQELDGYESESILKPVRWLLECF